jgi:hypothetical protein
LDDTIGEGWDVRDDVPRLSELLGRLGLADRLGEFPGDRGE